VKKTLDKMQGNESALLFNERVTDKALGKRETHEISPDSGLSARTLLSGHVAERVEIIVYHQSEKLAHKVTKLYPPECSNE